MIAWADISREVWLNKIQLLASSQPAAACMCTIRWLRDSVGGALFFVVVVLFCFVFFSWSIYPGSISPRVPFSRVTFPGLIVGHGKLWGFVETPLSNPFTLCQINWSLLTRSRLNLVQNISLTLSWLVDAPQHDKVTSQRWNYFEFKSAILYFSCQESKTVFTVMPWGSLKALKVKVVICQIFRFSLSIFIRCLIIHSKLWGIWQCL